MSANVRALTITGAIIAAVTYIVCAAFVALTPETATTLGAYIVHMDLARVGRSVTWGGALIGGTFSPFSLLSCALRQAGSTTVWTSGDRSRLKDKI